MIKIRLCILFSIALFVSAIASNTVFANDLWQIEDSDDPSTSPFIYAAYDVTLNPAWQALVAGSTIDVPISGEVHTLDVTFTKQSGGTDTIVGNFQGHPDSEFYMKVHGSQIDGHFYLADQTVGYRFDFGGQGELYKIQIDQVACLNYGEAVSSQTIVPLELLDSERPASTTVPSHQSLLGSNNVLYLDFDGETVSGFWADTHNDGVPIIAKPFDLDNDLTNFSAVELEYIEKTWRAVSEDYLIFDINVTTDRSVYDAASKHHRAQSIITETCLWYRNGRCSYIYGIGAVPQFGAFKGCGSCTDNYSPSWVWPISPNTGALRRDSWGTANDVSHEFGHGFWLAHDGINQNPYYQGDSQWGPIMGFASNADKMITFSKGEYQNATNLQDDIATIGLTHTGFRNDETETGSGEGEFTGIISSFDEDQYTFFAKPTDIININAVGVSDQLGNLDVRLRLIAPDGLQMVDSNVSPSLDAVLTHNATQQGEYRAIVSGSGSDTSNSYTRYGSIGQYTIDISRVLLNPDPSSASALIPLLLMFLLEEETEPPAS